jgi:hypothetical protein
VALNWASTSSAISLTLMLGTWAYVGGRKGKRGRVRSAA